MRDDRTLDDSNAPLDPDVRTDDTSSPERMRSRLAAARAYRRRLAAAPARARTVLATAPARARTVLAAAPGRAGVALAAGVVCCLGLAAYAQTGDDTAAVAARSDLAQRAQQETASRGQDRTPAATSAPSRPAKAAPASTDPDTDRDAPEEPAPVAGLTEAQMENAEAIVRTGREMGVPRRALVIAVATAMQESNLYNYASGVLPESQKYPHQAIGWDHDSVGLFQQRPSSGWGPVDRLMDPEFATRRFLSALEQVPGWQQMRLTDAAQAVQVSAYPEHYAKHEWRATRVVDAIVPPER
ncbi:peptidase M23 [Micromonospora globbae]|uniref:peptidase M23 n=1 Tax=Micromonospora globbae TaxID=1894969 RepID=UPI003431EAE8|nr:peptidase M23 [Micromonospora globbae]